MAKTEHRKSRNLAAARSHSKCGHSSDGRQRHDTQSSLSEWRAAGENWALGTEQQFEGAWTNDAEHMGVATKGAE
jgi:hypothetical protein